MLSWWMMIAILIGVAVISGLFFGLFGDWLGISSGLRSAGIGVITGIAAAVLITRRRAALNGKNNP